MYYRLLISTLILTPLHADFLKYGFDGDFAEQFEAAEISDNGSPFEQMAGLLIYHNDGVPPGDSTTIMELKDFKPTFQESWTLSVEVTIPNALRLNELSGDAGLFIGIGCYVVKDDKIRYFTHLFEMDEVGERYLNSETGYDENEPFRDQGRLTLLNQTTTLRVRYEGSNFTLFRSNQETGSDVLLDIDADADGFNTSANLLDWELDPEDELNIIILANCREVPITRERPLQMDNLYFVIHNDDTVDGGITPEEDLLNVEVKGFPTGYSELQKSFDLENWITIKTIRKGARTNMLLPSDNGQAHYRVVGF